MKTTFHPKVYNSLAHPYLMNQKLQEKMSGFSLEKLDASSHLGKGEADTRALVPLLTFR